MTKQVKADLALLMVTIVWGSSFVLTKNTLDHLSTYNFLAIRFILAATLSSVIFHKNMRQINSTTLKYGILIGFILFTAYAFQTIGLNYTTASKSGFITGFAVVIVPIFSALLLKERPHNTAILGVICAVIGLGFLTLDADFTLNIGDIYTLVCAFMFAFHILTVGKYTVKVDSIALGIMQIATVGVLSSIFTFVLETPIFPTQTEVWTSIFILAILATSGAYIIQNTMQKFTSPTHTALIYTGEPVFAALFAYLLAGEVLHPLGILGSILILSGMMISEVNWAHLFKKHKRLETPTVR